MFWRERKKSFTNVKRLASSSGSQPKDDACVRCERLLIQWLFSQMVLRMLVATVCHCWLSVSQWPQLLVCSGISTMSCPSAGADIWANMSPGSSSQCTPADHLSATQRNTLGHCMLCVFWRGREKARGLWSVCVFPGCQEKGRLYWWMSGGGGPEEVGRNERIWRTCVIDVSWLMAAWKALCSRSWVRGQNGDTCG